MLILYCTGMQALLSVLFQENNNLCHRHVLFHHLKALLTLV